MKAMHLIMVLGVAAVVYSMPSNSQGKNLITGVFIPSDAFQDLQDRANANSPQQFVQSQPSYQPIAANQPQYQAVNTNQPSYQPINSNQPQYQPVNTNQPQYQSQSYPVQNQPTVLTNQPAQVQQPTNSQPLLVQERLGNDVPVLTNQPLSNSQPISVQPVISNQPNVVYTQEPLSANSDSNQPLVVMANQPNVQGSPSILLVQQPSAASSAPIYVQQQPNQVQPAQVIFASNPSNGNQLQGAGSTVYTLIPLNAQNAVNSNPGGSYLIPVQSSNSNPIILSTGN
ncbi:integrator complex subunit 3 homolog [Spodoptera litura]|uniref:Integrator complex subunit 3 homolog n=1 Tax=Spodoptera litura TaxID=69820 RepID=A0A9J7EI62_SPOLT|nr:integrator complex subunit 3 homolog [Spodoptera litura]